MSGRHPKVDALYSGAATWRAEAESLRAILLDTPLAEDFKWGAACYTLDGANVAIIQRMKGYLALGFFKGALLEDPGGLLAAPGRKSQAMRQLRFGSAAALAAGEGTVREFVARAIAAERAGLAVDFRQKHALELPAELALRLAADARLGAAWEALTPGRRRGYVLHVAGAKQAATRAGRVEKSVPGILAGKGFDGR